MRPSTLALMVAGLLAAGGGLAVLDSQRLAAAESAPRAERASVVAAIGLTDLALFTEARYTRHPSMADRFSAFQDHPLALEHFPAGSVMAPPQGLQ